MPRKSLSSEQLANLTKEDRENYWNFYKVLEDYNKNNPYVTITEYIEFNKNTGLFYIRKCTNEGNGWKHCIPYGNYDTLKEAKEMVDFLEAHDWNEEEYKQFKNEL